VPFVPDTFSSARDPHGTAPVIGGALDSDRNAEKLLQQVDVRRRMS
jgi:hypothetical protein